MILNNTILRNNKSSCRTCGEEIALNFSKRWEHVLTGSIFCYGAGVLHKTARPR